MRKYSCPVRYSAEVPEVSGYYSILVIIDYESTEIESAYRGDTLVGAAILCNYYLQLFSTDTSIHGSHDPSMEIREDFPGRQCAGILVYSLNFL